MTLILFLYLYCYLWTEIISGFGVFHAESKHVFLNRVWPIDKLITLQGNHYSVGLLKTDLFWTDFSTKHQTIPLWTKTTITKKNNWRFYHCEKDTGRQRTALVFMGKYKPQVWLEVLLNEKNLWIIIRFQSNVATKKNGDFQWKP